jgi:ketosteroid isomerase-like protein
MAGDSIQQRVVCPCHPGGPTQREKIMSTDTQQSPTSTPPLEPHPLTLAMQARDLDSVVSLLAEDVVLYSPVTAIPFRGRAAVSALIGELIGPRGFERLEPVQRLRSSDVDVLVLSARIGGRDVEMVDLLRHDAQGRVTEIRIHSRPLASTAAFAAAVGPALARRRGRWAAFLVRVVAGPLPGLLAFGDRTVVPLTQPRP